MKREYAPLIMLAGAVLVLLSPTLFTGSTYFLRDLTYIFHPWKTVAAELLQKGEMPLWNPYVYCGMPFLANWQTAVFYPLSLPFYFFSFVTALKLFQTAHLLVAGIFAYLWSRSIGLHRWSSAGVMAVWVFNGYLITRLEFLSHCGVDVWLFAAMLFSCNPVILAMTLSIAFFAGHYLIVVVAAVVFMYRLSQRSRAQRDSMTFWLLSGSVFAGIIACQMVPTVELMMHTERVKEGLTAAVAMTNEISVSDILHVINPLLSVSSVPALAGEKFSWVTSFHVGICAFLCIMLACMRPLKWRLMVFSVALFVTGIVLALGDHTGVYPWLYRTVPFLSSIRYPAQFLIVTVLAGAIMTGIGLQRLRAAKYIVSIMVLELILTAWGFQITVGQSFFHVASPLVQYLQHQSGQSIDRFILSPGTEKDRHLPGETVQDAWQSARGMLYSLTCMPYHLYNAYGSGEPLTITQLETAIDEAYRKPTPGQALAYYQKLAIHYLICKKQLSPDSGYTAVIPHLYSLSGSSVIDGGSDKPFYIDTEASRTIMHTECRVPTILSDNEMIFPGWQVYVDGHTSSFSKKSDIFREVELTAGRHTVYELYRPASFRVGLYFTLTMIVLLCAMAIRYVKKNT